MGAKAKKSLKKKMNKVSSSSQLSLTLQKKEPADFLPLKGGAGKKLPVGTPLEEGSKVVYIGRIPHGFYEKEMEGFFLQFGAIKRLRIARNKKTGKSKHYGFIEFKDPAVAKIVAETMHNYLLFEHLLQVHLVPADRIHPKLWKVSNLRFRPIDRVQIQRKNLDKERTLGEHQKLVEKIMKQEEVRRKRIAAAGIDYECPDIVGNVCSAPKKIRFE